MMVRALMAMGATAALLMLSPASAAHCPPGKKPCAITHHAAPRHACHCKRTAGAKASSHARNWALHRPSTPQERAETARLNRELGLPPGAVPMRAAQSSPPPAPPMRAAQNPPPVDRQMRAEYDRRLNDRGYPAGYGPSEQAYAPRIYYPPPRPPYPPAAPPAPNYAASGYARPIYVPDAYAPDARLDPWHGYNGHDGLGNGY